MSANPFRGIGLGTKAIVPMDIEQLMSKNTVIQDEKFHTTSARYKQFNSFEIATMMEYYDYLPVEAREANVRIEERKGYQKHLVQFVHKSDIGMSDKDEIRRIVMLNSHDGKMGLQFVAGIFRFVCANGLLKADIDNRISLRHSEMNERAIAGAIESVIKSSDDSLAEVEYMKNTIILDTTFAQRLSMEALEMKHSQQIQEPNKFKLTGADYSCSLAYREEDSQNTLWNILNRVQENVLRGNYNISVFNEDKQEWTIRKSKKVTSIDMDKAINLKLWSEAMRYSA